MNISLNRSLHLLLLTMSLITQPIFAESDIDLSTKSNGLCCNKERCKAFINITENDINRASRSSTDGYVINQPGNYKLCANVNWTVKTPNSFAITIAADNVSLNLDGHFIKQLDTTQAGNFAIHITGDANYSLVHNGVLQQIAGGAILIDAGASCVTIDGMACNRCSYNGSTPVAPPIPLLQSWAASILINGSPDAPVNDLTITNCTFCDTGILGTAPVWFTASASGTTLLLNEEPLYPINPGFVLSGAGIVGSPTIVSGSGTSYVISAAQPNVGPEPMTVTDPNGRFIPFGAVSAIYAGFASHLTIKDNMVNGCFGEFFSWGCTFVSCSSLLVSNVLVNNTSTFVLAKGMEFFQCQDALIEDVQISNVVMDFTPLVNAFPFGHGAEGIKCGSSSDCIFRRVDFYGCRIQTQVPTAFTDTASYADCCGLFHDVVSGAGPLKNIVAQDCTAIGMVNDGGKIFGNTSYTAGFHNSSAVIGGIEVEQVSNLQYTNCSTSGLHAEIGWAYGFGSSPEPNFLAIENDITYQHCIAQDITISGSAIYATGFVLTASRNQVINCFATDILDQRAAPLTGTAAYGIILDNLTGILGNQEANHCIISGNRVTNCSTTGIFDNSGNTTNIFNSNYAALNGPDGEGPNYDNLPVSSAALIQDWPLLGVPEAPPVGGPVLANVSVRN